MNETSMQGNNIYLKPFTVEHITDDYIAWLNDSDVNHYLESRFIIQTRETVSNFVKSFAGNKNALLFGIYLKANNLHLGNISFSEINYQHGYGVIGLALGRKSCWGKGYSSEALKMIVTYGFNVLNLRRLEAGIYEDNIGSIKIFEKLGFHREAILRKRGYLQNSYADIFLFGLLKEEFQ